MASWALRVFSGVCHCWLETNSGFHQQTTSTLADNTWFKVSSPSFAEQKADVCPIADYLTPLLTDLANVVYSQSSADVYRLISLLSHSLARHLVASFFIALCALRMLARKKGNCRKRSCTYSVSLLPANHIPVLDLPCIVHTRFCTQRASLLPYHVD